MTSVLHYKAAIFVDYSVWETDCMRCCLASPSSFVKLHWPVQVQFSTSHGKWWCFICMSLHDLPLYSGVGLSISSHPPRPAHTVQCYWWLPSLGPSWWALVSACLVNLSTSFKVIWNMASLLFCSGELLNETIKLCLHSGLLSPPYQLAHDQY